MGVIYAPESKNILSITSHKWTDQHNACQVICQYNLKIIVIVIVIVIVSHMMIEK